MDKILTPKVLVVGGGPGGYVAAIRCGQLGLDTLLVDAERLGGTCLIRGCIPSKALIHAASSYDSMVRAAREPRFGVGLAALPTLDLAATTAWKDGIVDRLSGGVAGLLRRHKVRTIAGYARFSDAKSCVVATGQDEIVVHPEHVILATGSIPAELPTLPFDETVISSTDALSMSVPPRRLVVVGAGYIGLELGIAFAKLGAQVTIVEAEDRILPSYDAKLTAPVVRWLAVNGVTVHLGARALGRRDGGLAIATAHGVEQVLPADRILVAAGRRPATTGWGLETMNLEMEGAFIKVDGQCRTAMRGVWAIGDLVGEPMLAHKASAQGAIVAEILAGKKRNWSATVVPAVCYTDPEIVSVGLDPGQAAAAGIETTCGVFPFAANGRALSNDTGDEGGFVRVVARRDNHRIVGIQAVGSHVSELSAQFATLIEMAAVLEDVAGIIHAHPTLGEAVHEASLAALGHAIHI